MSSKFNRERNVNGISFPDYMFGFITGVLVTVLLMIVCKMDFSGIKSGKTADSNNTTSVVETEETESDDVKDYNTTARDFNVELASGESVILHTPEGFYNLTEMYADDFGNYYGIDISSYGDLMIHVGSSDTTYDSKTVVNAAHLEGIKDMMKDLAGDNYTEDLVYGEVYNYMKTGKQPEETDETKNIEITDLESFEYEGIKYSCYKLVFDSVVQDTSSAEAATAEDPTEELNHQEAIYCYSDTEDPIEFVVYQEVTDSEKAVGLIKEMVGAK